MMRRLGSRNDAGSRADLDVDLKRSAGPSYFARCCGEPNTNTVIPRIFGVELHSVMLSLCRSKLNAESKANFSLRRIGIGYFELLLGGRFWIRFNQLLLTKQQQLNKTRKYHSICAAFFPG